MEEEILARAKEQSHLIETVRAATIIKLMGREAERESAWRNLFAEVTNAGISVGKYQISFAFIQTLLSGLVNVIIIFLGARLILAGEGFSVGVPSVFVRVAECNLSCDWCDTRYTWDWERYGVTFCPRGRRGVLERCQTLPAWRRAWVTSA